MVVHENATNLVFLAYRNVKEIEQAYKDKRLSRYDYRWLTKVFLYAKENKALFQKREAR